MDYKMYTIAEKTITEEFFLEFLLVKISDGLPLVSFSISPVLWRGGLNNAERHLSTQIFWHATHHFIRYTYYISCPIF